MPFLNEICNNGPPIILLLIVVVGAKGTTHIPTNFQILQEELYLPQDNIKSTLTQLNTISIQFIISIILHKRRIEHHSPLPKPYSSL